MLDMQSNSYQASPDLRVQITVDETFNSDHRIVSQLAKHSGKFTFTAAEAGDHKLCFTPSHATTGGWLVGGQAMGTVKLMLDLAVGESSAIERDDKGKIVTLVTRVKELNGRLQDMRREQVFQRVCYFLNLFCFALIVGSRSFALLLCSLVLTLCVFFSPSVGARGRV